jgi:transposase InsO family protein/transposase-like protein
MSLGKGALRDGGSYSLTYNLPYWYYKFMSKVTMVNLSPQAEKRLSMIEFYYQIRNVTTVTNCFKISRKTFYKWLSRYESSGRKLFSLENQSKTPITKRKSQLSNEAELKMKHLREQHLKLGKVKLQILYKKQYHGEYISQNHVSQVITKYHLYSPTGRIKYKKHKTSGHKKVRINEINPNKLISKDKPFFFCCDTIVIYLPYGIKRYILTAIEHDKKIAYARVYKSHASFWTFDFLLRLSMLVDGKIAGILSDNGSEFLKYFDEACRKLKIIHVYSRVKTPKDNAINERFNRTLEEEFIEESEQFEPSMFFDDLREANNLLTKWLTFYNFERPHQTLKYKTPVEWYNHYQLKEVLPMYPTLTFSCKKAHSLIQSTV